MNQYKNIDEYLGNFEGEVRGRLDKVREIIKKIAPEAVEAIKYGMPTFVLKGKNLIHFAAQKKHLGVYPTPGPIEFFRDDLEDYVTTKGAIQFPHNKPMPYDLLKRIVEYRVKTY